MDVVYQDRLQSWMLFIRTECKKKSQELLLIDNNKIIKPVQEILREVLSLVLKITSETCYDIKKTGMQ